MATHVPSQLWLTKLVTKAFRHQKSFALVASAVLALVVFAWWLVCWVLPCKIADILLFWNGRWRSWGQGPHQKKMILKSGSKFFEYAPCWLETADTVPSDTLWRLPRMTVRTISHEVTFLFRMFCSVRWISKGSTPRLLARENDVPHPSYKWMSDRNSHLGACLCFEGLAQESCPLWFRIRLDSIYPQEAACRDCRICSRLYLESLPGRHCCSEQNQSRHTDMNKHFSRHPDYCIITLESL